MPVQFQVGGHQKYQVVMDRKRATPGSGEKKIMTEQKMVGGGGYMGQRVFPYQAPTASARC